MARIWDFSLRQLRTFLAVVERGGVSNAAEHLHVTQPAVSKVIRSLERSVGSALFKRRGRDVELTPAGRMFLRRASAAVAEFKAGFMEHEALREDAVELVRVFGAPSVLPVLVPRAIARLYRRRPAVQVVLSAEAYYGSAYILDAVACGDADLGITLFQDEPEARALSVKPLLSMRLCAVTRRDHPLVQRSSIDIAHLVDQLVVLPPIDALAGRIMVQEFSAAGLPFPPRRIIAANRQVTFGLVRECNAVAFMVNHPACADDTDEFAELPISFRQPTPWGLSLCQRANALPSPALTEFIVCIEALVAEAEARTLRQPTPHVRAART